MKYVIYRYAISLLVVTFYCASRPYRVSSKSNAILRGVPYSLLSLLGGCWAIPWGPIRTIQALIVNFSGGETILKQTNLQSEEPTDTKVSHTYPNLEQVKASIKALYKHFSSQTIHLFSNSISPQEVSITPGEDPIVAAHRFAGAIVRHLNLPEGSILVNYRNSLKVAGEVELTPENEYLVELHARYKEKQDDIAAILAHEITHVFLYRAGLFLPNTYENEILTDTASVYLGIGWLGLNAYRLTESQENNGLGQTHIRYQEERLGYLTPEEFGYVLGKRSIKFKGKINGLITNYFAKEALHKGFRKARLEYQQPPMKNCGFIKYLLYRWNKKQIINLTRFGELRGLSRSFNGYKFDISDEMRVVFECPVCSQKLRLPINKNIQAHCSICKSSFECKT